PRRAHRDNARRDGAARRDRLQNGGQVRRRTQQRVRLRQLRTPAQRVVQTRTQRSSNVLAQGVLDRYGDTSSQKRTVTLRGPQGNAVTLKVGEQVKQWD